MSTTFPLGFMATGINCGLKDKDMDLAIVVNNGPLYDAAGVFTNNKIKAAPVLWSQEVLNKQKLKAVILNSGGANACTGAQGFQNTHKTAEMLASKLGIGAIDIAVCSTGLIGNQLKIEKISTGIEKAIPLLSRDGGLDAAQAILTTDSHKKVIELDKHTYKLGAMIKGAGMLAPDLATMLCVITTDADLSEVNLKEILKKNVDLTLNRLDSDGCTSTNDSVILMASGASKYSPSEEEFSKALYELLSELTALLINDAEGSTKNISINVINALNEEEAVEVGRSIARNNLLKCAFFGEDPNWGRILAAIGNAKATLNQELIDVYINKVLVCESGMSCGSEPEINLKDRNIDLLIDLKIGNSSAKILTNDLSIKYVHENSAYSS